jgi:flagellar FliL protein
MAVGKNKGQEDSSGEATEPKQKKPVMMIMVLVIAAVLVFTCTLVFGKKISAKDNKHKTPVVEKGTIIPLDEFLVNLTDDGNDHFLKVSLALEFTKASGKSAETMKEDAPRVRDAVLSVLSTKSRADVSTTIGREKLKNDIKASVNQALGDDEVLNVYFVNFVTQ